MALAGVLRRLMPAWVAVTLNILAMAAEAQQITVGWAPIRNYYEESGGEIPSGYWGELAVSVGEAAGLDIAFRRFPDIVSVIEAQAAGDVDMLAGIGRLPILASSNVFSEPVAQSSYRLFVRSEDDGMAPGAALPDMTGKTVGLSASGWTPFEHEALPGARVTEVASDREGLFLLLAGEIDGLVALGDPLQYNLRTMRLDHRISSVGPPLQTLDRFVAIHRSRADLLGRVNAAIAELEASGTLEMLQSRWSITLPAPEPDILTVGVTQYPPFSVVQDDGTFTGYSVEMLRGLARKTSLKLRFVAISREQFLQGPSSTTFDVIAQTAISEDRARRMDFTHPISESSFSIFVRSDRQDRPANLDDLAGSRLGVTQESIAAAMASDHGGTEVVTFPDAPELVDALREGKVDAILNNTPPIREIISTTGLERQIVEVRPPLHVVPRAVALRFGLGRVRERLNAAIPGFMISLEAEDLRREWFATPQRINMSLLWKVGLLFSVTALLGAGYLVYERRRRRTLQRETDAQTRLLAIARNHNEEMALVVEKLERSNAELDSFAYVASHDLKAPLRVIDNASRWLAEDLEPHLTDDTRESMELLRGRVKRMERLLDDLLEHSRIGRVKLSAKPVTGAEIEAEIRGLIECPAGFEIAFGTGFADISLPMMPIKQVLLNLVSNAIKHHDRDAGQVNVDVTEYDHAFEFTVTDDGPGIPPEYHGKVFEMFQTLKPRDQIDTSGIGLAMVSKQVDLIGGDITLMSDGIRSTSFRIIWPREAEDAFEMEKMAS